MSEQQTQAPSANEKNKEAVLKALASLGRLTVPDDSIQFNGDKLILPSQFAGPGGVKEAIQYLYDYEKQQETKFNMSRTFKYRPWDGANAFNNAMLKVFGSAGLGKAIQTMFGEIPPQLVTIETGLTETVQVPWGDVALPQLDATFSLSGAMHREYGQIFQLSAMAPRKYRAHVEAFFQMVEHELKTNSIYKGKAINGAVQPQFVDVFKVDRNKVYYSEETMTQLEANFFTPIRHADTLRSLGVPLKRAILVEGPYGTGKTLAGLLAGQVAVQNGFTWIVCRPGQDNLAEVLQTAQLYAPAVVWYEDIDVVAGSDQADSMSVSKILDMLDSVGNKGTEVIAGFTTNHVESLQKGVMRPGRLDAVIHVGQLDRKGIETLVRVNVPAHLLDRHIDFDTVAEAYTGYLPSFAVEATQRALRYAVARTNGNPKKLVTADFVDAANGLRRQNELMSNAGEGPKVNQLDAALSGVVGQALTGTTVADRNDKDEAYYQLVWQGNSEN